MDNNYTIETRDISKILRRAFENKISSEVEPLPKHFSPYGIAFASTGKTVPSVEELAATSGAHDVERTSYVLDELNEAYKRFCGSDGKLHPALIAMDIRKNGLRLSEDVINLLPELTHWDMEFLRTKLPVQVYERLQIHVIFAQTFQTLRAERYEASQKSQVTAKRF
jgi:hypothetical protein